jgi:hypothetical protein
MSAVTQPHSLGLQTDGECGMKLPGLTLV